MSPHLQENLYSFALTCRIKSMFPGVCLLAQQPLCPTSASVVGSASHPQTWLPSSHLLIFLLEVLLPGKYLYFRPSSDITSEILLAVRCGWVLLCAPTHVCVSTPPDIWLHVCLPDSEWGSWGKQCA